MVTQREIMEAYIFLREHNHSIPDETLEFIKVSALEALENLEGDVKSKKLHDEKRGEDFKKSLKRFRKYDLCIDENS